MKNQATHLLWNAAGMPQGNGHDDGVCCICGHASTGMKFADWVRDTFTDLDKILPGDIICHACQFSFEESSQLLASHTGKEKPQRMRNYSHFVSSGKWIPLTKADKKRMAGILRGNFQVAVIAESGQKHIAFRAVPGIVQFEEHQVQDVGAALVLLDPIQVLYATTFSKAEIETGQYKQHRIIKFGLPEWHERERQIAPHRGSAIFDLALFLAQKGDSDDRNA